MPYLGNGLTKFTTADNLTVSGTSELKDNVTVTGDVTASGTLLPTGDTAAGDDAAIGFTSTEGLILTGQGSTSDITVKNDADATVFTVPTGTDDILFPDNAKAMFGAGSDLQIYHNGSHSYIDDTGTGNLYIRGDNINFRRYTGDDFAKFISDGAVELYYDNSKKLETTSTGISVTGTTEASVFKVGSGQYFDESSGNVRINNINNADILFRTGSSGNEHMRLTSAGGLGIANSGPTSSLVVSGAVDASPAAAGVHIGMSGNNAAIEFAGSDGGFIDFGPADDAVDYRGRIRYVHSDNTLRFYASGAGTQTMTVNNTSVGIGVVPSGSMALQVNGQIYASADGSASAPAFAVNDGDTGMFRPANNNLAFTTGGSERMRIASDGDVYIGKTSEAMATAGSQFRSSGQALDITRDGGSPLNINRLSSSGELVGFFQDTAQFGQITCFTTNNTDYLQVGSSGSSKAGVVFETNRIYPTIAGSASNGVVDLGTASVRFQNGWFSNILYSTYLRGQNDTDTGIDIGDGGSAANTLIFYTGGSERARFDASGNFFIAKTSDSGTGTGISLGAGGFIRCVRSEVTGVFNRLNDGQNLLFQHNSGQVGSISVTSSGTTFNTTSDRRLKSNIKDAASASSKIDAIQVRQFDWNADGSHQEYGLIAQELEPIAPIAVCRGDDDDEMMSVDYSKLVPMLLKEIQELRSRVAALEE